MKKLFTTALIALAAAGAFAQVDPNRTVAIINGEEIKGGEYYQRMEFLPGVGKKMGSAISEFPPGFLTLEELITERLVFQLAKQKGVLPTDLEINAEYQARKADDANLDQNWIAGGRTLESLKYLIKYELAQYNIQTFGVTVTDAEVSNYYTQHPDEFTIPKRAKLRVIVLTNEADKASVDSGLGSGKTFADMATKYSADVSRSAGGDLGLVPFSFLGSSVRATIEATKIGQTTDWVSAKLQDGTTTWIKYLLENVEQEKKVPLDDRMKRQIRRKMAIDRGRVKNNIEADMKTLRQSAKIDIKNPEFAEAYRRFIQAYLNQK